MKKFTLLALGLLLTVTASAQQGRKTWDFRKGFSATTIAALEADNQLTTSYWADYEKNAGEGAGKYYMNTRKNVDGTACTSDGSIETPIPELEGLNFGNIKKKGLCIAYNYDQGEDALSPNGLYTYGKSFLWFNGSGLSFSLRTPANTTLKMGIESHKKTEVRGFNVIVNGQTLAPTNGNNIPDYYNDVEWNLPEATDGTDSLTVQIKTTSGAHIYYIIVGEGDTPVVEANKKIGFIYGNSEDYDVTSDPANVYISGAGNYDVTNIDAASTDVTLDSLQKFDALVINNNVAADAALVPVLKTAIAYEPIVNLNSKLYSAWGYGSEVTGESASITVIDPSNKAFASWGYGSDEPQPIEILTEGNVTGVKLGEYFAADDTLATIGGGVAIHQHNKLRNSYLFLPYGNVDLTTAANQESLSLLLPDAVADVAATKVDVTNATAPQFTHIYKNKLTRVAIKAQKDAKIFYTIDGTEPTMDSEQYKDTLEYSAATTLKAVAFLDGYLLSNVAVDNVDIKEQANAPVVSVEQNAGRATVTISQDQNLTIYYNLTGSNKMEESSIYTEPIVLAQNATFTTFAIGGEYIQSEIATADVQIAGLNEENTRSAILAHYNTTDWSDGSKANYLFSWGKSSRSIYSDPEAMTLADYEAVDILGWKIMSRGQVVTLENTGFGSNVGDGNGYNPDTALDAMIMESINNHGTIEITKGATTFGGKEEGEPYSACVQTSKAIQGPFDVVTYCANGNGSSAPEIAVFTSTDGENFSILGDTLTMDQGRRLYRRSVVSYDGTDKVFVRVAHVGGGSKAMLADIYVLGVKGNADGISTVSTDSEADAKVVDVFSVNGMRLATPQRGLNIVKYSNGTVRKVLVK